MVAREHHLLPPVQVAENMQALSAVSLLTDDVMAQIETILDNKPEEIPFQWGKYSGT